MYRARVLADAGYQVVADPPDVDERAFDELFDTEPVRLASELARRKAAAVAGRHPASVVVAGDQVGVLEVGGRTRQLTKQSGEDAAVAQLMAMSATTHRLVNAVVVVRTDDDGRVVGSAEGVDEQLVTMRPFDEAEARAYVRRFEPYDSAGSYRLEDQEVMAPDERFVVDVRGEDPSGVLGMPLPLLARLLDELERDGAAG